MAKKLFVGNIAWGTTDDQLHDLFAQIGALEEAKIVIDRVTGRSKGIGFVTYVNDEDADKAKKDLSGADLNGRAIFVDEARPQVKRDDNREYRRAA